MTSSRYTLTGGTVGNGALAVSVCRPACVTEGRHTMTHVVVVANASDILPAAVLVAGSMLVTFIVRSCPPSEF